MGNVAGEVLLSNNFFHADFFLIRAITIYISLMTQTCNLTILIVKDGAYFCYCAHFLRTTQDMVYARPGKGHWGGDRKKCNGHCKSFQKRSITFKNAWLPLHFML